MELYYKTHPNSHRILGPEAQITPSTFAGYKKMLELDKKGDIKGLFRDGQARRNDMIPTAMRRMFGDMFPEDSFNANIVATKLHGFMLNYFSENPKFTQEQFETACRAKLKELVPDYESRLSRRLLARSSQIFSQVAPFIKGEMVLDVGAGNGRVGGLVDAKLDKRVALVDVMDYNSTSLKLDIYDGQNLPYKDKQFDTSIVSVVFHHAEKPLKVLEETIRVTNKRIIVIESVYFNEEHRQLAAIMDWFYNRVLHEGVNCPFNFQPPLGWEDTFVHYKLKIASSIDLGIDHAIAPEYHWLYALDVPSASAPGQRKIHS